MQAVIPISDVIAINKVLNDNKIAFKVHLHDACGAQTLELRSIGENLSPNELVRDTVQKFFATKHRKIEFFEDGKTFHAI